MEQKNNTHHSHYRDLFNQLLLQMINRAQNKCRSIVIGDHYHALGKTGLERRHLLFHPIDNFERIFPIPHHHNTPHHLSLTIPLRQSPPQFWPHLHSRNIFYANRRTVFIHPECNLFDICHRTDIPQPAHHKLRLCQFDQPSSHIVIAPLNRHPNLLQGNIVRQQAIGIHNHLILLHKSPHRRHFRHALHTAQLITQIPILNRAQFRKIVATRRVQHRILINPAHTRRIWAQLWRHSLRQSIRRGIEILQHPTARPVHICSILKNYIHIRNAKKRITPHRLCIGHGQHCRRQRIRHLIFHDLRCLPRIFAKHNHLHIRQIGNRIQWRIQHRIHSPSNHHQSGNHHQKPILDTRFNNSI